MLYKNKFAVRNTVTDYSPAMTNDVEWYVYGSASDGRVATVYPRFKVRDNDTYNDNFEDDPPSLEVAYNTEMISNTFTTDAESAGITGIETHRHLGEKRYEIKDHLGNVRAVTSDIKNASNYNLVASSWKFLADLKSMNNYFPYGLKVKEASWSASNYQFAYNGKQEEVFDKDFLDFGTRPHNTKYGSFITTDLLEVKFPEQSPYIYAGNNPITFIDKNGTTKWTVWHYDVTCDIKGKPIKRFNQKRTNSYNSVNIGLDPNASVGPLGTLVIDDGEGGQLNGWKEIYTYKGTDYTSKYDIPDGIGDYYRKHDEKMRSLTTAVLLLPFEMASLIAGPGQVSYAIKSARYGVALIETYFMVDNAYGIGAEVYNISTGDNIPTSGIELGFTGLGNQELGKNVNLILNLAKGTKDIFDSYKKPISLSDRVGGINTISTSGVKLFNNNSDYDPYDVVVPYRPSNSSKSSSSESGEDELHSSSSQGSGESGGSSSSSGGDSDGGNK